MQSLANQRKRSFTIVALLTLALLLALPIPAGAQDMMGDGVFISIRLYEGVDPKDMPEIKRQTRLEFVPIVSTSEGFLSYYVVYGNATGEVAAINVFETQEQASASNELARQNIIDVNSQHLLPNAPQIVEGTVDIGFVEMLDGMGDGDVSQLHASVRIYDEFEMDNLDGFVTSIEEGFLPIMRETDGFFGYYAMNDGSSAVATISIFDSESSALASHEKARDFVEENLTAFLPNDPLITSGRVGIAVLADLNDGVNLIDDVMVDDKDFVSIRVYEGVDPADQGELAQLIGDGFLPIMRESDGFVGYYLLPAGDVLVAISLFETHEQALASTDVAREFVAEYLAPLLPNPPMIVEGHIDVMYVNDAEDMMDDGLSSLYASLRIYEVENMDKLEEANRLVKAYLLPALHEAGGLFSYYALNDGDDTIAGLNVYTSESNALAANDIAAAFNEEHNVDWLPDDPLRVNGQLGVAALAEMHMGENLVGAMLDG